MLDKSKIYTSSIRTHITISADKLRTERQWAKLGYIAVDNDCGKMLWVNQYCQKKLRYLYIDEVKTATKEELYNFFKAERERNNSCAKKRREQACKDREKIQHLEYEVKILECLNNELKKDYLELKEKYTKCSIVPTIIPKIFNKIIELSTVTDIKSTNVIVIDTETTGLNCTVDELLQVSIISKSGEVLYNSYFKPLYTQKWKDAQAVNNISSEMVADAPTAIEECAKINAIISKADVIIGYNTYFDLCFLENIGCTIKDSAEVIDIMTDFAEVYGEWSNYWENYKWQKLSTCAAYYGYDWGNNAAHNSLADCYATLFCYQQMCKGEMKKNAENKN